jgi:putative transposase
MNLVIQDGRHSVEISSSTSLEQTRLRYRFVIAGYVVMPEHFHLMISEPQTGTPSTVMQVLKQRFSRQISKEGTQPVWQGRFYDFNIWTERNELKNSATCIAIR